LAEKRAVWKMRWRGSVTSAGATQPRGARWDARLLAAGWPPPPLPASARAPPPLPAGRGLASGAPIGAQACPPGSPPGCPPRCQSPRLLPDRHPHSPVGMPGSPALQGALRRRPGGHDHSTRQLRSQPHCLLVLHRLPRAAARGRPMPPRGRRERPRRAGAPPAAAASSTAAPRAAYPCRARAQVHASTALSRASVTSVTPWLIRRSKLTSACHSV